MPRDYRRPSQSQPTKRKQNKSCVWWLIVGVALGVVITKILAPSQDATESAPEAAEAKSDQSTRPKPNFTFEKVLTEAEDDDGKAPPLPPPAPRPQPPEQKQEQAQPATPTPAQTTAITPEPETKPRSGTYVVQVGSFSRAADAERLKAQLALLGISTNVQAATLSSGRVTHRVRTGGFASRQEAKKIQDLLKRNGKDSLAIPIK
ncbi:SPOR domain-containing protein [Thiorhodococcus mannitoliphagus]|uniref:SPOR domain-containing protein n=1 Tax=Thiorhodococcus mannitoliphagus TaxID=329406 RepID=A0A6P1DXE0_9GAMM|nr:SPOR domain-containing protein [Thiorhodococcus mannitoliphagus]NEX22987.1 SPOR domain-containing protein [Thiorhodococcus mannitoliphagus]